MGNVPAFVPYLSFLGSFFTKFRPSICRKSGLKNWSSEEMVRSMQSHHDEEEEEEDEELDSRTTDGSSQKVKLDGKSTGQQVNALRSKHSETEQRRRSKINERQA
ncbi:basic helix-loop-helix (bHLH) DNA-binding superfamily protein [Actinidia rufa]|uniref:Basic helix-loop-helix (BHLH) DNA-binding superfamily protein n=1 Tax=Actinidia rufa TaxID=165716 RepID=A0A7J0EB74_9ERIC|nr:basic helix-loop-helix (bHLH) DNA-binding superfamily protein [Actinidia rufa]